MTALKLAYRIWRRDRIERKRLYVKLDKLSDPTLLDRIWWDDPAEPGTVRYGAQQLKKVYGEKPDKIIII